MAIYILLIESSSPEQCEDFVVHILFAPPKSYRVGISLLPSQLFDLCFLFRANIPFQLCMWQHLSFSVALASIQVHVDNPPNAEQKHWK